MFKLINIQFIDLSALVVHVRCTCNEVDCGRINYSLGALLTFLWGFKNPRTCEKKMWKYAETPFFFGR